MKQTLEQRLLEIVEYMDDAAFFIERKTGRAMSLQTTVDALRSLAKEVAGRVLTRPKLTDHKGETFSCRLASITIESFEHHGGGKTDEEAIVNLQGQIDAAEAPSPSAPKTGEEAVGHA